jgi:hypothetical protein
MEDKAMKRAWMTSIMFFLSLILILGGFAFAGWSIYMEYRAYKPKSFEFETFLDRMFTNAMFTFVLISAGVILLNYIDTKDREIN